MNRQIKKKIKKFEKEEKDLKKKLKNLIIKCIKDNYIPPEELLENKEYHIWDLYPTCTIEFEGIDEILKIEKEWHSYYAHNDFLEYTVYGKRGLIHGAGITDVKLKEDLLKAFKNNKIALEIIEYLYSGKTVDTYEHKTWEECINNYE